MLIQVGDTWVNVTMLEYVFGLDPEETGPGGTTQFKGVPGFVRFDTAEGRPVLINSRSVAEVRAAGAERAEVETARGKTIVVAGGAEWVACLMNGARRAAA